MKDKICSVSSCNADARLRGGGGCKWLGAAWSTDRAAVYQWLKDVNFAPTVTLLTRSDSTATASLRETDNVLQDSYRPIGHKHADPPTADSVEFYCRSRHHVHKVPLPKSPLYCNLNQCGCTQEHPGLIDSSAGANGSFASQGLHGPHYVERAAGPAKHAVRCGFLHFVTPLSSRWFCAPYARRKPGCIPSPWAPPWREAHCTGRHFTRSS